MFPAHKIGFTGNSRRSDVYAVDLTRPLGQWKKAWRDALHAAGVRYRWHDCRHSFVSRLASNPTISESTLKALSGHVSKRMLEHYSHVHAGAKQAALQSLETADFERHGAGDWAQSSSEATSEFARAPNESFN